MLSGDKFSLDRSAQAFGLSSVDTLWSFILCPAAFETCCLPRLAFAFISAKFSTKLSEKMQFCKACSYTRGETRSGISCKLFVLCWVNCFRAPLSTVSLTLSSPLHPLTPVSPRKECCTPLCCFHSALYAFPYTGGRLNAARPMQTTRH